MSGVYFVVDKTCKISYRFTLQLSLGNSRSRIICNCHQVVTGVVFGRVNHGSGKEVFVISRDGSSRVRRFDILADRDGLP